MPARQPRCDVWQELSARRIVAMEVMRPEGRLPDTSLFSARPSYSGHFRQLLGPFQNGPDGRVRPTPTSAPYARLFEGAGNGSQASRVFALFAQNPSDN